MNLLEGLWLSSDVLLGSFALVAHIVILLCPFVLLSRIRMISFLSLFHGTLCPGFSKYSQDVLCSTILEENKYGTVVTKGKR